MTNSCDICGQFDDYGTDTGCDVAGCSHTHLCVYDFFICEECGDTCCSEHYNETEDMRACCPVCYQREKEVAL